MKKIDLTGRVVGRWTVIEEANPNRWFCRCQCGREKVLSGDVLRSRRSKSCGCLAREVHAATHVTHGLTKHPLYKRWCNMRERCLDETHQFFNRYGGRGITICDEWSDFQRFYDDNIDRWSPELTLDRIDNNAGYSLANTRWTTRREQSRNRSNTVMMTMGGETLPLVIWSERTGIPQNALRVRMANGWSHERALTTPVQVKNL